MKLYWKGRKSWRYRNTKESSAVWVSKVWQGWEKGSGSICKKGRRNDESKSILKTISDVCMLLSSLPGCPLRNRQEHCNLSLRKETPRFLCLGWGRLGGKLRDGSQRWFERDCVFWVLSFSFWGHLFEQKVLFSIFWVEKWTIFYPFWGCFLLDDVWESFLFSFPFSSFVDFWGYSTLIFYLKPGIDFWWVDCI